MGFRTGSELGRASLTSWQLLPELPAAKSFLPSVVVIVAFEHSRPFGLFEVGLVCPLGVPWSRLAWRLAS